MGSWWAKFPGVPRHPIHNLSDLVDCTFDKEYMIVSLQIRLGLGGKYDGYCIASRVTQISAQLHELVEIFGLEKIVKLEATSQSPATTSLGINHDSIKIASRLRFS